MASAAASVVKIYGEHPLVFILKGNFADVEPETLKLLAKIADYRAGQYEKFSEHRAKDRLAKEWRDRAERIRSLI